VSTQLKPLQSTIFLLKAEDLFPGLIFFLLCDTSVIVSMLYCARKQKTEAERSEKQKSKIKTKRRKQ